MAIKVLLRMSLVFIHKAAPFLPKRLHFEYPTCSLLPPWKPFVFFLSFFLSSRRLTFVVVQSMHVAPDQTLPWNIHGSRTSHCSFKTQYHAPDVASEAYKPTGDTINDFDTHTHTQKLDVLPLRCPQRTWEEQKCPRGALGIRENQEKAYPHQKCCPTSSSGQCYQFWRFAHVRQE